MSAMQAARVHRFAEAQILCHMSSRRSKLVRLVFFRIHSHPGRRSRSGEVGHDDEIRTHTQTVKAAQAAKDDLVGETSRARGPRDGTTASVDSTRLRHVEVLDTDGCSPGEVLRRIYHHPHEAAVTSSSRVPPSNALHAEEEFILCYPVEPSILERRIRAVVQAWLLSSSGRSGSPHLRSSSRSLAVGDKSPQRGARSREKRKGVAGGVTVGRVARLCLWEHEYGATLAAEMMWAYLHLYPDQVRLTPPPTLGGDNPLSRWHVHFIGS